MRSGFKYKEYLKWSKNLGMLRKDFNKWLKEFLLMEAQKVVATGKLLTPVDTGYLINSWYIGSQKIVQKDKLDEQGNVMISPKSKRALQEIDWSKSDVANIDVIGNYLKVYIGLSAEYAASVEYGHDSYEGQYMLTISINKVQKKIPAEFNEAWRKLLIDKGVII